MALKPDLQRHVDAIANSGKSIYDVVERSDPFLWVATAGLEAILDYALRGTSLAGMKIRTRSKAVKSRICDALGYTAPVAFKKTQPRFPGQDFDVYVQKASNLQIWNEEVTATRRYVLVGLSHDDVVTRVRVVAGQTVADWDTTGTLTRKYQARLVVPTSGGSNLLTCTDTPNLQAVVSAETAGSFTCAPTEWPTEGELLTIRGVSKRLAALTSMRFPDPGADQERNRGAELHRLVCTHLGYGSWPDTGQFPDIPHQLLEVKLQTSTTIDLGLVSPTSEDPMGVTVAGKSIRHCDVRYAICYGASTGTDIVLSHVVMTTGAALYHHFPQFGGNVANKKLQIRLPDGFLA